MEDADWGLPLWEEVAFVKVYCNDERWWIDSSWQTSAGSYQINSVKVCCTKCFEGEDHNRFDEGFVWYVWKVVNKQQGAPDEETIQLEDGGECINSIISEWI